MRLTQHREDWDWRFQLPFRIALTKTLLPLIVVFSLLVALAIKIVEWKRNPSKKSDKTDVSTIMLIALIASAILAIVTTFLHDIITGW